MGRRPRIAIALALGLVGAGLLVLGLWQDSAAGVCRSGGEGYGCGSGPGNLPIALGTGGLWAGIVVGFMGQRLTSERMARRVRRRGRDATATIVGVVETGTTFNDVPEVRARLRVEPAGGEPYEAEVLTLLSELPSPARGARVPVRYDPAQPSRVALA